ncbi:dihydroorotase [Dehalococcoidia bacterium]|nr:dihydroorotase [Dehalococcoidia bacterium]
MRPTLIKGGRILDPSHNIDRVADLLLERGKVAGISDRISPPDGAQVFDATGMVVCPGFIDLHCHLREPGFEYKETIASGTRAAAKGGFTTVCAMPNTQPNMDTRSTVDFVLHKARTEGVVRVLPIGCVTKDSAGKELAEMGELAEAGCIGFSDDGHPVADSNIMRLALTYSTALGLPIINHCETPELFRSGTMNEGWVSNRLGMQGVPNSAEETMVARDISLAEMVGGRAHLAHISTRGTLDLVRRAKENGTNVTCEVTPHHLTLTDEAVMGRSKGEGQSAGPITPQAYDTYAKVNPPLRTQQDVDAMVAGLNDGVIDFVATDHAPHNRIEKLCTFQEAAFGISVLETALGSLLTLVHQKQITLPTLIDKLTHTPARFLGRTDIGSLRPGSEADVTVIAPDTEWTVDTEGFISRGKNSPLHGSVLRGAVVTTIVGGKTAFTS